MTSDLQRPAAMPLDGAGSIAELAEKEGWQADDYAIKFAEALCSSGLETQRERLAALIVMSDSLAADGAAASELGRHYVILDALFRRLIIDAMRLSSDPRRAEAGEKLLAGAMKAQRGALACLSALKTLRETQALPVLTALPPRAAMRALATPDNGKAN